MELTLVMAATTLLLVALGFMSLNDEPRPSRTWAERGVPSSGPEVPVSPEVRRG
ncbi:hypothetical protein L1280_001758 [Deinococcus sp. HSC-46F16]|uniref:hypothetical protein n=1 Tax=Deinococcus sp. HSC-46F16 TaxID=2910968 RepID=UPI00209F155F|nr:hypothetical protein [Deinococcus sp. HSC-46F16]MCP2014607.1 hypothetical protein [Deinococcus sp. HSC-46F16]